VFRDGHPVQCRDAIERRDRLIEKLAALPPVQGALDQIVQRFGADMVAEVTGRPAGRLTPPAVCFALAGPSPAPRLRPIGGRAASPHGSIGRRCASIRRSGIARTAMLPASPGRDCSPP
jgi:hypothetical protein